MKRCKYCHQSFEEELLLTAMQSLGARRINDDCPHTEDGRHEWEEVEDDD